MSYLGQVELKSSDIRRVDVTSSTSATHTLTWIPPSEQSLIVTINGVKQQNNYTISGTTLTLDSALIASDELEVVGILDIGTTNIPADDSITNAMVKSSAAIAKTKLASLDIVNADVNASAGIVGSKLADNAITLAKLEDGTQGDILYYGASGAPTRLGFGTSGYFLKTQGTGANPVWATVSLAPAFSACVNDATVSFSDATETKVTLNREIFDSNGAFDHATNYRFTVPAGEGGKYLISGGVKFIGTGTFSNGQALVFKNGSDIGSVSHSQTATSMGSLSMGGTWLLDLAATDYLELYVYLDVASGVIQYNGNATSQRTWMSGFKLVGI